MLDAASRVGHGEVVSSRFFRRHMVGTIVAMALILSYIAARYDCITSMETIDKLSTQCEVMKTRLQTERSTYMTSVRECEIKHRADSVGLTLSLQNQPPYSFTYTAP